jgi:mono/diheme cytochrome c family protein
LRIAGALALVALAGTGVIAIVQGASDPPPREPEDYQRYDLKHPWFDTKHWDWFLDMFNQPSVKPQQEGTIQQFPLDSVPRTGVEPFIAADAKIGNLLARDALPKNPVPANAASIANGKFIFETYCGVCHGNNGMGNPLILAKGMPAPPIGPLLPVLSEAHLYNKALYGGPLMPSYGFQTSAKDRWDLVNYAKSAQFGK